MIDLRAYAADGYYFPSSRTAAVAQYATMMWANQTGSGKLLLIFGVQFAIISGRSYGKVIAGETLANNATQLPYVTGATGATCHCGHADHGSVLVGAVSPVFFDPTAPSPAVFDFGGAPLILPEGQQFIVQNANTNAVLTATIFAAEVPA